MNSSDLTLLEKINRRVGHVALIYKGSLLIWGGYQEHSPGDLTNDYHHYHRADELFIYNCYTDLWCQRLLQGDIPPRNSGTCAVELRECIYVFGGYIKTNDNTDHGSNSNKLYCLNLKSMTWKDMQPYGFQPISCDKLVGWEYNGKVYYFGGFGSVPQTNVPYKYVLDNSSRSAWNNQLVAYNPQTNSWEWPQTAGCTPSPRAAHAADKIGHRVFICGGRLENERKKDLYILDMESMRWSRDLNSSANIVPVGRSWHTFNFISPTRAVLYGGFSTHNMVLSDTWFVDLTPEETGTQEVQCKVRYTLAPQVRSFAKPRFWHKTLYMKQTGELYCSGGLKRYYSLVVDFNVDDDENVNKREQPDDLLVIHFTPISLLRLSLRHVLLHRERTRHAWDTLPQTLQVLLEKRSSLMDL